MPRVGVAEGHDGPPVEAKCAPTDVAGRHRPMDPCGTPRRAGRPEPRARRRRAPAPVVMRRPAPGIAADPCPAKPRIEAPPALVIRTPAADHVREPDVAVGGLVVPAAVGIEHCAVGTQRRRHVVRGRGSAPSESRSCDQRSKASQLAELNDIGCDGASPWRASARAPAPIDTVPRSVKRSALPRITATSTSGAPPSSNTLTRNSPGLRDPHGAGRRVDLQATRARAAGDDRDAPASSRTANRTASRSSSLRPAAGWSRRRTAPRRGPRRAQAIAGVERQVRPRRLRKSCRVRARPGLRRRPHGPGARGPGRRR